MKFPSFFFQNTVSVFNPCFKTDIESQRIFKKTYIDSEKNKMNIVIFLRNFIEI